MHEYHAHNDYGRKEKLIPNIIKSTGFVFYSVVIKRACA